MFIPSQKRRMPRRRRARAPSTEVRDRKFPPAAALFPVHKQSTNYWSSDAVLARVETEKKDSLLKAWEENEKAKVENW